MKKVSILLFATILFLSCSTSKTLRFTANENEIYTTEKLSSFLAQNKKPKVVLRVSNTSTNLTDQENIDYLYNTIENQLLKSGFIVRDRQLFNQIAGNDSNNIDYQKIKEKSDTDLIIELTKLDPSILYKTNKYYNKNNKEKIEDYKTYERYGASVEFKVVTIDNNEYGGVYKFNYAPCTEGCKISSSYKEQRKQYKRKQKEDKEAYEGVEQDALEEFIKNATKNLVDEMRS